MNRLSQLDAHLRSSPSAIVSPLPKKWKIDQSKVNLNFEEANRFVLEKWHPLDFIIQDILSKDPTF